MKRLTQTLLNGNHDPAAPVAAMDLGSNMLRGVVGRREPTGATQVVHRFVAVPRLAEGLGASDRLGDPALARVRDALVRGCAEARRAGASRVAVVATGALRLAGNRETARAALERDTGLAIDVISGAEEAGYAFRGACGHLAPERDVTFIDIGGTTTEVGLRRGGVLETWSVNLGVITLFEGVGGDPDLERMCARARETLRRFLPDVRGAPATCIASGGAAVALAAFGRGARLIAWGAGGASDACDAAPIDRADLAAAFAAFCSRPPAERAARLGISERHADLIPAGHALLSELLDRLGIDALTPTSRGVAEGVLDALLATE